MYSQAPQYSSRKTSFRVDRGRSRHRADRRQERVRLTQLLVCLALFLTVFVSKGVFPGKLLQVRDDLLTMISANTDFQGALARLGESLAGEGTVLENLGEFCVEVFGPAEPEPDEQPPAPVPQLTGLLRSEQKFLTGSPDAQALAAHFRAAASREPELVLTQPAPVEAEPAPEPEEQPAVAAVGAVLLKSDYSGKALPERYTMDQLSLGALETVTPVLGHVNSGYGYRDHPINGKYQFHGGLDIGGQKGDPIRAFAAGTVEYVGEDSSYGLYFQLDHGNGVKSFYAHCRSVCVKKGQTVELGQKVGEVGSSGSATGPHLHFELKCGGVHLDPTYYIDVLSKQ